MKLLLTVIYNKTTGFYVNKCTSVIFDCLKLSFLYYTLENYEYSAVII